MSQPIRKLAAILFSDIAGSTLVMQKNEQHAIDLNRRYMSVLKQAVPEHGGEILNDYGDGSLCSFSSATAAVRCAMEIQQELQKGAAVPLRIGLHVGEIFLEDGKAMGDGVNVASRIQSLGVANSILFSSEIQSKLKNQQEFKTTSIGKFRFKNVEDPLEVFALSNEGFALPDLKKIEGKLETRKGPKNKVVIAAVLVLLVLSAFLIYRRFSGHAGYHGTSKSIGVLPFETISSEKENEYVSDGFTIDIISKLSKVSGLQSVPGWARVKIFKNTTKALKEIASELDVATILTGTIQKQADRLHINAELIDVSTGKTIWTTDDERSWGDVLKLQGEVAEKIVSSLSTKLSPEEREGIAKQGTDNAEAYRYYIKGRYFWDSRTPATFDSAETNYKKATSLDPNYALAYAGLADLYIFNQRGLTQIEAIPIANDYVNKALSLDSTLGEALTTKGFIEGVFDYNWKKSKVTLEKALRLSPNFTYTHIYYGNLLQMTGQDEARGLEEIRRAKVLDPTSVSINYVLGRNYYLAGKYDLSEEILKKAVEIAPKYSLARSQLTFTLTIKKKYEEAIKYAELIPETGIAKNDAYRDISLILIYLSWGKTDIAREMLDKLIKSGRFIGHKYLAVVYGMLNEKDKAFQELELAYRDRELFLYFIKLDPQFDPIKDDPRFKEMLRKMNLN